MLGEFLLKTQVLKPTLFMTMENNMLLKSYVNDDCDNSVIKQKIDNIWTTMKSQKKQELIISAYQLIADAMRNSNELTPIIAKQSLVKFSEFD